MESTITIILSFTGGVITSVLIFLFILKQRAKEEGAFLKEKEIYHENKKSISKKDLEFEKEKLLNSFLKGKEEGIIEERKKLQVLITPYFQKDDGIFTSKMIAGYTEEVTYNGFTIGEPSFRTLKVIEKFKQENFDKIYDLTIKSISSIASNYLHQNINVISSHDKTIIDI